MDKTPVKIQKDRSKTVNRSCTHKVPTTNLNSQPHTTHHAPRKTEYHVPSLFFEKAGDNKETRPNVIKRQQCLLLISCLTYPKIRIAPVVTRAQLFKANDVVS